MRRIAVLTLAAHTAFLSACASASKRVEQGQKAEREGRSADAAARYVQALKKDRTLESARAGLRDAGARALAEYAAQAAAEDAAGRADQAADAFVAADELRGDAAAVGVTLDAPADYDGRRRLTLDRAIDAALGDAQSLAAGGRYDDAARRAERAAERWLPNGTQRARLVGARAAAHLAGAREDTARGRFRAAYERADRVTSFDGTAMFDVDAARALQAAALARGARRVAVVPVWATERAGRALPPDALGALADELLEKPWTEPPTFVSLAPAPLVQRELRRLDLARRTLSTSDAARLGRALDADLVVVAEVDSVRADESNVKATRRAVKTTGGVDTAYTVEEGRRRVYAHVTYDLVDPATRRVADRQTISATTTGGFKRARYAGDPRTLDLRRADRDLFDPAAQDRDLARELAEDLSQQYARDLFDTLLRRIP